MAARAAMRRTAVLVAGLFAFACQRLATPAGSATIVQAFGSEAVPITRGGVSPAEGGWRIEREAAGSVLLFEVAGQDFEDTMLTYRARLKASDVRGRAFLEMWVRVPGRGEFFSRGVDQPLEGTSDWASYEIPFFLNEPGVRADLVKLNVAFEGGGGTVLIKDVALLQTPVG